MENNNIQGMWTFNIYTSDAVIPFGNVTAIEKNEQTILFHLNNGSIVESPCDKIDYDILLQFQKTAATVRFNLNIMDYIEEIDFMADQKEKARVLKMLQDLAQGVKDRANKIKSLYEHATPEERAAFHKARNDEKAMTEWIAKMEAKQN